MTLARCVPFVVMIAACTRVPAPRTDVALEGETMGSTWHVKLNVPLGDEERARALQPNIDAVLERINDEMSTYRPNSELSRFNAHKETTPFAVSAELAEVVQKAIEVGAQTDRAFDVTLDPLIDLWGFDRSGRKVEPPTRAQIAEAMTHVGLDKIKVVDRALHKTAPDVKVNLGGIAAGFAVDVVAAELERAGFADFMVEVTGEVRARGRNARGVPWRIGIKVPDLEADALDVLAAVSLEDKAVTTSGSYHNFFVGPDGKRYSHILDPKTGAPVQSDLVSVSVLANDAHTADAFDTAFIILGEARAREILARRPDMEAFFIRQGADGKLTTSQTKGFPLVKDTSDERTQEGEP